MPSDAIIFMSLFFIVVFVCIRNLFNMNKHMNFIRQINTAITEKCGGMDQARRKFTDQELFNTSVLNIVVLAGGYWAAVVAWFIICYVGGFILIGTYTSIHLAVFCFSASFVYVWSNMFDKFMNSSNFTEFVKQLVAAIGVKVIKVEDGNKQ